MQTQCIVFRDSPCYIFLNYRQVARYPGAIHKSFRTREEAMNWLKIPPPPSTSRQTYSSQGGLISGSSSTIQRPQNKTLKAACYSSDSDIEIMGHSWGPSKAYESDSDVEIIDAPSNRSTQSTGSRFPICLADPDNKPADCAQEPSTIQPDIELSAGQKTVLERVKAGGNVFFTGSAGISLILRV